MKSKIFWFLISGILFLTYQFREQMQLVRNEQVTAWSSMAPADCAVVLTGGSGRVREGLDLLSRKAIKKLIISGVNTNSTLTEIFPLWAFYPEIKEEDIILERRSETTYGNAQQSLPIVEALNCKDVALITSHLHMYRAFKTFRNIYPLQIEISKRSVPTARRSSLGFWDVALESFKSLFYSYWAY